MRSPNPAAGLMDEPGFRRGLKRLPAHDLTFEAWIYHPQIATLTEVARAVPETKIVLNHFGGPLGVPPYKRSDVFPMWRAAIKELSRCPNVYVKLGGLAMIVNGFDFHAEKLPPSSGEMANAWRPYVEACMARAAIRCCGTRSSGWRAGRRPRRRPICSPAPRRASTAWASRAKKHSAFRP